MLKNGLLLTFAFLLSLAPVSAQTQASSAQTMPEDRANDCVQNQTCRNLQSTSDRTGTDNATRPNPFSIRVDDTSVDSTKAPVAQEPISRSVIVADAPTEFQMFVESSVGKRLPLFGYNLFQGVPSTFAPLDQIAVPANYIVGPGDELLIRAWGQIDVAARVRVDRNGQIYLPKIGSISVAGVSYEALPDHL